MRCPLTAVFGKDVANLIYRYVWNDLMTLINDEYSLCVCDAVKGDGSIFFDDGRGHWGYFNNRQQNGITYHVKNIPKMKKVAALPNNYWHIKELY